ncbi:DUF4407 domain-containing protein [Mycobacterium sp. OTB74]|uniref:DUF4407 domain-containing protein n=1 Tax=Mycobacterium sp. OTB74 TaxID=1853452 RepID=UPI002474E5FD|nr:DUF4407 domain-containing protein [Mycobacterium sp. OTB74]MDH6246287.1 hypothetical protein [Mycobacterium sp. OTB74]
MAAHSTNDDNPAVAALTWTGGLLAWLVAAAVAVPATGWPLALVLPITLVFGLVVVAAIRSTVGSGRSMVGRVLLAVSVGVLVGELCAMTLFTNAISQRLEGEAAARTAGVPSVAAAGASLEALRTSRGTLDAAVNSARQRRDDAQVVARCEYHPTSSCAQQPITGVPGDGQITQNAQEVLGQNQRELDSALAARDRQGPALDARIADAERALTQARGAAVAGSDRGFGTRWVAMDAYTLSTPATLAARLGVVSGCILLYLLPMLLHARDDRTVRDRHSDSRLRAELRADTDIAVKQAQARAAAEIMKTEHQLTAMRVALEADAEIHREYHRQRVADALAVAPAQSPVQPAEFLGPTAAAPEAPAVVEAPAPDAPALPAPVEQPAENLPVPVAPETSNSPVPGLPDLTRVAARWLRPLAPLVPPVVTRAIDTSTQQLRSAQKVIEEFEEITFTLRRTLRVTVNDTADQTPATTGDVAPDATVRAQRPASSSGLESPADRPQLESGRLAIEP